MHHNRYLQPSYFWSQIVSFAQADTNTNSSCCSQRSWQAGDDVSLMETTSITLLPTA